MHDKELVWIQVCFDNVHGSLIPNSQKLEAILMSIDEWMDEQTVVDTHDESNSALRGKALLMHTTLQINLEDIMLGEISQTQKAQYCMISLTWNI